MNLKLYKEVAELSAHIESGKTLFDHIIKHLRNDFKFDDVVFAKIDEDQTHSVFMLNVQNQTQVHDNFEETTLDRFPLNDGVAGKIVGSTNPLILDVTQELSKYPELGYLKFIHSVGIRSMLATAILAGTRPIGIFYLQSRDADNFSQADIDRLNESGAILSMAFSNILFRYRFKVNSQNQRLQLQINNELLQTESFSQVGMVLAQLFHCRIGIDFLALTCVTREKEVEYEIYRRIGDETFVSVLDQFEETIDEKQLIEEKRNYIQSATTRVFLPHELEQMARTSLAMNRKRALFGVKYLLQYSLPMVNDHNLVMSLGRSADPCFTVSDIHILDNIAYQTSLTIDKVLSKEKVVRLSDNLAQQNQYLQEELREERNFTDIIGHSDAIHKVFVKATQVAPTASTVLVTGETGTGKELVAHAIHDLSTRANKPFIKVNMASLPENLIESELFGHEKGSFTGALAQKKGKFEIANGGTLFLDEIGEMPLSLQAKLLRVLQEQEIERVGGVKTIPLDVRIVAATNRNLVTEVQEKRFREDLYYRLNVFPIHLPPLRERREDIKELVEYFVDKFSKKLGRPRFDIDQIALQEYTTYSWPGNIRELEHLVEKSMILSGDVLELASPAPASTNPAIALDGGDLTLDEVQKNYISKVLEMTKGKIRGDGGAAEKLGLKPTTLESKMKKLGLKRVTSFG